MTQYLIYFNQSWIGDHADAWYVERGQLVRAVVNEMKAAGVHVFTGGLEEDARGAAFSVDPGSDPAIVTDGPYAETKEVLGGITVIDVADDAAAKQWASRVGTACGWPQEVRRFNPVP